MSRRLLALLTLAATATASPSLAGDTHFYAYDGADRLTRSLTSGITLEVDKGLFGAIQIHGLFSTTARGSATLDSGGPDGARDVLPDGATETNLYGIDPEGQGRGLTRALCPGADEAWLITGRVRAARPLTMQAVGRWPDGVFRHCATLSYQWRGEWAQPPGRDLNTRDGARTPLAR